MSIYNFPEIVTELRKYQQANPQKRQDFFCDLTLQHLPKYYALAMFPYPSGHVHMGHVRVYTLVDIVARFHKLRGYNVLNPIGFDAFGLPAENAAIVNNIPPDVWTALNIKRTKEEQFIDMGFSFDWDKELNTSDPEYYKWTQWIFLQFFKHQKAYKAEALVNWCEHDGTVLADEQVIDGKCWRDGTVVQKRYMTQWFLRLSDYAPRLWDDLALLKNWSYDAVAVQRNWINKSTGSFINFSLDITAEQATQAGIGELDVPVFTTRADTLFGVVGVVLAPEHPLVAKLLKLQPSLELEAYVQKALNMNSVERLATKEKTGVKLGFKVRHPLRREQLVELWVADYVLGGYGTGAVMLVPAHDERDFAFAQAYGLPIIEVIKQDLDANSSKGPLTAAFTAEGVLVNSGEFTGLTSAAGKEQITKKLAEMGQGAFKVIYNLRDWSVGRQRYWGCPIPIINCPVCGPVAVPESELPVTLPKDVTFTSGKASIPLDSPFRKALCPTCGRVAERELDTLDTFICSSWYAFRFIDVHNQTQIFNPELVKRWMPIDFYIGGLEHAGQHMIYFRFFTKFFQDIGLLDFSEPVDTFFCNGMVRKNGAKMSKSKGNVIIPTEVIKEYGADALRLYILSDTPADQDIDWDDSGIVGKVVFLKKSYRLLMSYLGQHFTAAYPQRDLASFFDRELLQKFYTFVQKIAQDLEHKLFHVCIARIHEFSNALLKILSQIVDQGLGVQANDHLVLNFLLKEYLVILGMFAPFFSEIIYLKYFIKIEGQTLYQAQWPKIVPEYLESETVKLVVQTNGAKRQLLEVARGLTQAEVEKLVLQDPVVKRYCADQQILKTIYVPDKIFNIVLKKNS